MADPTKQDTEAVFKVLKSQKGNKVRMNLTIDLQTGSVFTTTGFLATDVFRLPGAQSDMVERHVWRIHLH